MMSSERDPAEPKESQQKRKVVSPVILFSYYLTISAARTGQSFLLILAAPPGEGAGEATAESRQGQEDSREGRCVLFIGLGWALQGDAHQSPVIRAALWTCCESPRSKSRGGDLDDDNDLVLVLKFKDALRCW